MRAIVTGAAGFIGGHLRTRLAADGHQVIGIDKRPTTGGTILDLADVSQKARLASLIRRADIVFHLAGRPGVRGESEDIAQARQRDNVDATRHLLDTVPWSVPVIAASSSSVYGGAGDGVEPRPCSEGGPVNPLGSYGRSKLAMEKLCDEFRVAGGRVAIVRPFTVAGEGQRKDMAIARWISAVREGQPVRIFGSPHRSRDITDVRDVVEGMVRIQRIGYEGLINLGTGQGHKLIEIVQNITSILRRPARITLEGSEPADPQATLADTRRCQAVLGFVPDTDLTAVIERQVSATRSIVQREVLR